ncbi:hypothetical protein [Methylobacterium gnaphalii]|uniref:Uncharacterized protein n=1 Tax=Methylobacterium gnaphalii TaxID=1010610 RepID=A0A512JRM0_9HYPH|nr:hypothetical protein [Methylobacterium gnaphalii]GEP12595.1 hypothetical protein MGN01_44400 [Methylobacterium gnaphalii]GLS48448.1 hypothetical protein GCM10007885_12920 [Methylobacterium gnaphalii]
MAGYISRAALRAYADREYEAEMARRTITSPEPDRKEVDHV